MKDAALKDALKVTLMKNALRHPRTWDRRPPAARRSAGRTVGRPTVGPGFPSQAPQYRKSGAAKSRGRPLRNPLNTRTSLRPCHPDAHKRTRPPTCSSTACAMSKPCAAACKNLRVKLRVRFSKTASAVFRKTAAAGSCFPRKSRQNALCSKTCGCSFQKTADAVFEKLRLQLCSFQKKKCVSTPLVLQANPQSKTTSPRLICCRAPRMGGAPLKSSLAKSLRRRPTEREKLAPAVLALKTANVRTNNSKTNTPPY